MRCSIRREKEAKGECSPPSHAKRVRKRRSAVVIQSIDGRKEAQFDTARSLARLLNVAK